MATPGQGSIRPQPVIYQALNIVRMSDSLEPSGDASTASLIYNAYPQNPRTSHKIVGRPGVTLLGTASPTGLGQMVAQFRRLSGTAYTVLIIAGNMYTVNWAVPSLVSVALPGWLTFQTTGKIYWTVLADKLIISDGVRAPVSWDGTTFVDLTMCPVLFGQPVVHYAKLHGIIAANPVQICWSEENDPTVGYLGTDAVTGDPYDNQWVLGQTSQDRLYVLMPTADALYFSRGRSWSIITGPNEDDYRSSGNREAVSNSIGCVNPSLCIFRNDEIWFADINGFFHTIAMGGQPQPIWEGYRETIAGADKDPPATTGGRATLCSMVEWPLIPLVMATVAIVNGIYWRYRILTWNPETKECQGVWDLPTNVEPTHLGTANNLNELDRVIMVLDETGHVLTFGTPAAGPWQDTTQAGTAAITHKVIADSLGWDDTQEKDFESITALYFQKALGTATIGYTTPRRLTSVPQTVQTSSTTTNPTEIRRKVGVKQLGRWLAPETTHTQINEIFGFLGFEVGAYVVANGPKVK